MSHAGRDIAGDARRLQADLGGRGNEDAVRRIDDAIAGGATGTESLFRLRGELGALGRRGSGVDRDLRARARKLARAIDRQLKSI